MVYTNSNSTFPSQVVPDEEKQSLEYGRQVAQAIEYEWFNSNGGAGSISGLSGGGMPGGRWGTTWQKYHNLRLYARGEQPVQKYKDELSINGDLSYLNLDWKPIPVISKFVDIVVNGISSKAYEIKATAQDPFSVQKKTKYAQGLLRDMMAKKFLENMKGTLGINLYNTPDPNSLPSDQDELELHLQLNYKQAVEIAEEELINNFLANNKYDLINKR